MEGPAEVTDIPSLLYGDVEDDLRLAVRGLLADRAPIEAILERTDAATPFDKGAQLVWDSLVRDLGIAALPVPEKLGGAGASWRETAVVLEELGRGVVDVPFLTSAVFATALAQQVGLPELTSDLASGSAVGAVVTPFAAAAAVSAAGVELAWDGTRLSGVVPLVAGAAEATHLLVPARECLLLVEAEVAVVTTVPSFDMTRRVADINFDAVPGIVVAEGEAATTALVRSTDLTRAMLASEQFGLAERMLEMTVDHLKERRQFGRALGSYQALKHRLADIWTSLAQARAVARYAAACAAEDPRTRDEITGRELSIAASLAQAVCSDVAVRAAEESVQLHGGIGFTWEHPAHLYLKRARADALALGTPAWHRRRLARLVELPEA